MHMTPRPQPPIVRRLARVAAICALAGTMSGLALPERASAHPLGNFTINVYNGLTIGTDRVVVDRVVDMAEIPALQQRQAMDTDGDGAVSPVEGATWAEAACHNDAAELRLGVGGAPVALAPTALGLTFPEGQAGLLTLRLVCTLEGSYAALANGTNADFRDETFADRIGWREIIVRGDGVTLSGADAFASGSSDRLRSYPSQGLEAPRAQSVAAFQAAPGGPSAPAPLALDAVPLGSDALVVVGQPNSAPAAPASAAVPGTIVELPVELSAIIQAQDLTPPAILVSLLLAILVGAVHAASPGHGKTLMAAYLVGTRGTARHALGLGLTVTVSHTIGVLALGVLVVLAGAVVPSERLFPILGLVSGVLVTGLGAVLLAQRVKEARQRRAHSAAHADGHAHEHPDELEHSHGLVRHTHLPTARADTTSPLRWRNLAVLGLVGGLVPSASAILILVGAIAAGRPAFGLVLTLAFGTGMAAVLVGVGVLLVRARNVVERLPRAEALAPLFARLPLVTAVVFLVVGATITLQAGAQLP